MFCGIKGKVDPSQLPPCRDSLRQYTLRANYQAAVWRPSFQAKMEAPEPSGHGWIVDNDGNLTIKWMTGLPAPAVLDLLSCDCHKSCSAPNCTQMCWLKGCQNAPDDLEDHTDAHASDDDDDNAVDDIHE